MIMKRAETVDLDKKNTDITALHIIYSYEKL